MPRYVGERYSKKASVKAKMRAMRSKTHQEKSPQSLQSPSTPRNQMLSPSTHSPPILPQPVTPEPLSSASQSYQAPNSKRTTSARKLGYITKVNEGPTLMHDDSFSTTIVHLEMLKPLFTNLRCSECSGHVSLFENQELRRGLSASLYVKCMECGNVCGTTNTSRKVTAQAPEVNRAVVTASLSVGVGHNQLTKMFEVLGMPTLHLKTHQDITRVVHKYSTLTMNSICKEARRIVQDLYEPDAGGVRNITVSFDGTWHKRGHTSLNGAAAVICAVTGLVIDVHVMSLYCQLCQTKKDTLSEEEFEEWQEEHAPHCQKNFDGSSGAMEVEAAKVLWGRSLQEQIRYTTVIGDGDCKMYNSLLELRPYGDVPISKAECVNHVAKRLGTGLRNLVNEEKKRGVTLGGRGDGTLTQEKIARLQVYFTKAVRGSKTVVEMQSAIWAGFLHSSSTDAAPQHQKCPSGADSWCFYQRAIALGEEPPSHRGRISTYLKENVAASVSKVYTRLTDTELLERCLLGKTQNPNESFHAQIWLKCPKHIFTTRRRVEIATALALGEWNKGSLATRTLMWNLGLEINSQTLILGQKRDAERLKAAEADENEKKKHRREVQQLARTKELERRREEEGPLYVPGGF